LRVHDGRVATMGILCDVPVHELTAGDQQLLQPSRNWPMHQAGAYAHLRCGLRLESGRRYLLLGRNGVGKSTLLQAIADGSLPDWPERVTTYLVAQGSPLPPGDTPLDAVLAADARQASLLAEARRLEEEDEDDHDDASDADEANEANEAKGTASVVDAKVARLCEIYDELDALGAEDEGAREGRALAILDSLGVSDATARRPVSRLSGGWQMRVALAAAVFVRPALLMLDEPTNHLDMTGSAWLARWIRDEYAGTAVCVSHDRAFVNACCDRVIVFANRALDYFGGTLDAFEKAAAEKLAGRERLAEALRKKKGNVREQAERMKTAAAGSSRKGTAGSKAKEADAKRLRQAASRAKKLGRMGLEKTEDGKKFNAQRHGIRIGADNNNDGGWIAGKMTAAPVVAREDPTLTFEFPDAAPLGASPDLPVVDVRGASFAYPGGDGSPALERVDLVIRARTRLGVCGRNGSGKSTLVGLLSGALEPGGVRGRAREAHGEILRARHLVVATYDQSHVARLEKAGDECALGWLRARHPGLSDQEARGVLGSFGLRGDDVLRPLPSLSGGQRVRVAFAELAAAEPHLLILDEPTNHLDVYSVDAMVEALRAFEGAVVLVTHDRHVMGAVAEELVVVSKKTKSVRKHEGTVDEYLARFDASPDAGRAP